MSSRLGKTVIRAVLIVLPAALLASYVRDILAGQSGGTVLDIFLIAGVLVFCTLGWNQWIEKPRLSNVAARVSR